MPKVGVALRFLALAVIFVPWFLIQTDVLMLCSHLTDAKTIQNHSLPRE